MSEELKKRFRNGMIPDENDFASLIDFINQSNDLSEYAKKSEVEQLLKIQIISSVDYQSLKNIGDLDPSMVYIITDELTS